MSELTQVQIQRATGASIRRLRKSKGVSQADLAAKIGLTRTALVNIEQGRQGFTVWRLFQVAQSLDVELKSLIAGIFDCIQDYKCALEKAREAGLSDKDIELLSGSALQEKGDE